MNVYDFEKVVMSSPVSSTWDLTSSMLFSIHSRMRLSWVLGVDDVNTSSDTQYPSSSTSNDVDDGYGEGCVTDSTSSGRCDDDDVPCSPLLYDGHDDIVGYGDDILQTKFKNMGRE